MYSYYGAEYLKRKLGEKRLRVLTRYSFYEMKNTTLDFGISTPPDLRYFSSALGWCAKGVDALADRLLFEQFDGDVFGINEVMQNSNPDILFDSAILECLIGSCSFAYISFDENGNVRVQIIDAGNATGIIDTKTGLLTEGYAVLERDQSDRPVIQAYFTERETVVLDRRSNGEQRIRHSAGVPLLVPIMYRPDARRPFGHSRISRAAMSYTGSALRTIKRGEISAEFYSFPQKYVTNLDPDAEILDKWKSAMSAMISFDKDEDGDHPIVGQFSTGSQDPHIVQLRMFASLFAGETGLTLDDLGFATDNPSSAEAIKASHENLRLTARKAQRTFSTCFRNIGYTAACLRDGRRYDRKVFNDLSCKWSPIFEPDASMLSGIGDAISKINTAIPGFMNEDRIHELTGM